LNIWDLILEEVNKKKFYAFETSCGDVLVTLDKISYAFCDINLRGIENDIIVDTKEFESKFILYKFINLTI